MGDWGQGGKGALGGAASGAAIGSVAGPYGTVIGGAIGGIGGFLSGYLGSDDNDQQKQMIQDYYNSVKDRQAPQAGPAAQSSYSDFRGNQQALVGRLEAMANGQGPSLAAQQFQQATDRNVASQQAVANSGRGGAMAQLTAANNMAGLGAQAAQGSAIGRTAEEMQAISQLGGVINQGRSSDEQNNQFNAGQTNSMSQANLEAQLRAMGYNDSAIQSALGLNQSTINKPGIGDQFLAGGTSALAQWAATRGAGGGAAGSASTMAGGSGTYTGAGSAGSSGTNVYGTWDPNKPNFGQPTGGGSNP